MTAAAHDMRRQRRKKRTTTHEICFCYGFELRRLLSADLREWQALCAWKISGPIDETKPLVDEEFATFSHVLPNFSFVQNQESEVSVAVYNSLFWSGFNWCRYFEWIVFVHAQAWKVVFDSDDSALSFERKAQSYEQILLLGVLTP